MPLQIKTGRAILITALALSINTVAQNQAQPSDELAAALQAHAKATIAPYKYPREIAFVDSLPKTATGKLRRSELRGRPA